MDMAGPEPLCLAPHLMLWDASAQTVGFSDVQRNPMILRADPAKNVDASDVIPRRTVRVDRECVAMPHGLNAHDLCCLLRESEPASTRPDRSGLWALTS